MKESFNDLYTRLYQENFTELEAMREKAKNNSVMIIFIVATTFIIATIFPIVILFLIIGGIIWFSKQAKASKATIHNREKTYAEVFKEKIVGPIIENVFEGSKYSPKQGISEMDYRRAGYNENYDRYSSEDLVLAPFGNKESESTFITFSEVHTEDKREDSDGHTTYVTIFQGLTASFLIPKDVGNNVFIRSNGRVSSWNNNKVKMDMPEFEKVFDVESEDAILAMRILTADIMVEMLDLYNKYKYKFEINIRNDMVYMRLRTGPMFEPEIFRGSMEYKTLEKYYLVLKALTDIASHIYDNILKLEV